MSAQRLSFAAILAFAAACGPTQKFQGTPEQEKLNYFPAADVLFKAGRSVQENLSFTFLPDTVRQTVTLEAEAPQTKILNQIVRPRLTERFTQGHSGERVEESFGISNLDKMDLLLVIDNSSSMGVTQIKLGSGLSSLIGNISNTDWRMMVTTTSAVRSRNPLNPTQIISRYGCPRVNTKDPTDTALITHDAYIQSPQDAERLFSWKVAPGELGDPIERGLLAAVSGLQGECGDAAKSWTRPDSHKVVLMVTDEENCGSDEDQNCDSDEDSRPEYFMNNAPGVQFFALLHDLEKYSECIDYGYVRKPDDYRAVIAATGGLEGNICLEDFHDTLKEISRKIMPVQRKEYPLRYQPVAGSIVLLVNEQPWQGTYELNGQTLVLSSSFPAETKSFKIAYRHDPKPSEKDFPLKRAADPSSLTVRVNGVIQAASIYKYENQMVRFEETPAEQALIDFEYCPADGLATSFALPAKVLPETVTVQVDEEKVAAFKIENQSVVFTQAPVDGARIALSYEVEGGRRLSYPGLSEQSERVISVSARDSDSKEVPLIWEKGQIDFAQNEVAAGRTVNVVYVLKPDTAEMALQLQKAPLEGSLAVDAPDTAQICVDRMTLNGTRLNFPCPSEELGNLHIRYDYITQVDQTFTLSGKFSKTAQWKIEIDGVEVKDYVRDGNTISFPGRTLSAETEVHVVVSEKVRY